MVPPEPSSSIVRDAVAIAAHHPRVLAGDCGKVNLVAIVERLADGRKQRYVLSRGQYQREMRHAQRKADADARTAWLKAERQGNTRRTATEAGLGAFQRMMARQQDRLLGAGGLMLRKRWANDRFWARAAKESSLKRFFGRVLRGVPDSVTAAGATPAESALLVLGDSVIPSTLGGVTSPTIAVVRAAVGVFGVDRVRFQDEHRTTKTHAVCGAVLQEVRATVASTRWQRSDVPGPGMGRGRAKCLQAGDVVPVRGLRRCECCGVLVDRDINAAWNIRTAFTLRHAAAVALEVWGPGTSGADAPGCAAGDRPPAVAEHLRRAGGRRRPGEYRSFFHLDEDVGGG